MHRAHTMPRQARTLHLHRACTLHAPQCTTSHRLRRRLGEGSFGIVYRSAVDGWRGATVAVKVLRTELTLILSLRLSLSPTLTL